MKVLVAMKRYYIIRHTTTAIKEQTEGSQSIKGPSPINLYSIRGRKRVAGVQSLGRTSNWFFKGSMKWKVEGINRNRNAVRNMSLRSVKATSVCRSTFNGTVQAQRGRYHFCFLQKLPIFFFGNSLSQKKHVLVERRESLPLTWMNGWKRSFNCGLIQTRHLPRRSQPIKTITREIKLQSQWRGKDLSWDRKKMPRCQ